MYKKLFKQGCNVALTIILISSFQVVNSFIFVDVELYIYISIVILFMVFVTINTLRLTQATCVIRTRK